MNFNKFRKAYFCTFQYLDIGKGFSLLEVLVALAVFGLIISAAAGTFSSIQHAWRVQRNTIDIVQNSRWAMEFLSNDLRRAVTVSTPPPDGNLLRFTVDPNADGLPPFQTIEYQWANTILWRRVVPGAWQEAANFIPNPAVEGYVIFSSPAGGLYTIQLRLRPQPTLAVGRENRNYTLRTQVRPRN